MSVQVAVLAVTGSIIGIAILAALGCAVRDAHRGDDEAAFFLWALFALAVVVGFAWSVVEVTGA